MYSLNQNLSSKQKESIPLNRDEEEQRRQKLVRNLEELEQEVKIPLQAIQAMMDVSELKKKCGYQRVNSYQVPKEKFKTHSSSQSIIQSISMSRHHSINQSSSNIKNQVLPMREKGKQANQSTDNLLSVMDKAKLVSPLYKINARPFVGKFYENISKETIGINSLFIDKKGSSLKFPKIDKVQRDEQFEYLIEKSLANSKQTDDLLANISLIMAGPDDDSKNQNVSSILPEEGLLQQMSPKKDLESQSIQVVKSQNKCLPSSKKLQRFLQVGNKQMQLSQQLSLAPSTIAFMPLQKRLSQPVISRNIGKNNSINQSFQDQQIQKYQRKQNSFSMIMKNKSEQDSVLPSSKLKEESILEGIPNNWIGASQNSEIDNSVINGIYITDQRPNKEENSQVNKQKSQQESFLNEQISFLQPKQENVEQASQFFEEEKRYLQDQSNLNRTFEDDFEEVPSDEAADKLISPVENLHIPNRNNFRIEPLEDYDEYALRDADFNEMLEVGPQQAMSRWVDTHGKAYWKNCTVLSYDKDTKSFLIQWNNLKKAKLKKVKRLNLMFSFDDPSQFKKRYRAAVKKREEFLFNLSLTHHIDSQQSQEYIPLSAEDVRRLIDKVLGKRKQSNERKESILNEIMGLYRFQLVKFTTEFEAVKRDVELYYDKYLPYLSARNFVVNMPIKDRERFDYFEYEFEQLREYESPKPHLCLNKNNLGVFRWINFGDKTKQKLDMNETACLRISQKILGFIHQIDNLNFFKTLNNNMEQINCNEEASLELKYSRQFNREIDQVDRLSYRVEKGIDELKNDFQSQINENSSKLLYSLANKLLLNSIEIAAQASVKHLVQEIEKYYAFLPLPELALKVIKKLPEQFFQKRSQIKERLQLDSDQVIEQRNFQQLNQFVETITNTVIRKQKLEQESYDHIQEVQNSQNSETELNSNRDNEITLGYQNIVFPVYKSLQSMDRQIMNSLSQTLLNQFLENSRPLIQLNFLNESLRNLPAFPKLEIDWVLNKDVRQLRKNMEQRKFSRDKNRNIIYNDNEQSEIVLIKQRMANQDDDKKNKRPLLKIGRSLSFSQEDFVQKIKSGENQLITESRFDFVNFSYLATTIQPSPQNLENLMRSQFFNPLERILKIYQIGLMDTLFFESTQLKQLIEEGKDALQEILPWSFYGIYSFLILMNSFSFIFTQKKYYLQDIQIEFEKNPSDLQFLCDEIDLFERDFMFFRMGLPNFINFGFFLLRTEDVKMEFANQIRSYITSLKQSNHIYLLIKLSLFQQVLTERVASQLELTKDKVESLEDRIRKQPSTLKEYVEFSDFLTSTQIQQSYNEVQSLVIAINDLMNVINSYYLPVSEIASEIYIQSGAWLHNLHLQQQDAHRRLEIIRPKFEKVLSDKIKDLKKQIEVQKIQLDELKEQGSLSNVFQLSHQTKSLKLEIDSILEQSQELNKFEEYLRMYPQTDFSEITNCLNDLMKYYDLWDFAERWRLKQEEWTTRPIIFMESKDVVDTINEGFQLLPELQNDFGNAPRFVEIIHGLEEELSQFNSYTHILIQLRDVCFKQRHWEELLDEIYAKKERQLKELKLQQANFTGQSEKKLDSAQVTLKKLIEEDILSYSAFINKLYQVAMEDFAIEIELSKIEGILKESQLKTLPYYLNFNEDYVFKTLKNTKGVLSNIAEAKIRAKSLITNKSHAEVFRKRMNGVYKLARVSKKLIKRIAGIQNIVLEYCPLLNTSNFYENQPANSPIKDKLFTTEVLKSLKTLIDEFSQHMDVLTYSGFNIFILFSESESLERSFPSSDDFRKRVEASEELSVKLVHQMKGVLAKMRLKSSRLYFISDDNIIDLIRLANPNTNPQIILHKLVLPLFKGINSLKVVSNVSDHTSKIEGEVFHLQSYEFSSKIESVENKLKEILKLDVKIELDISKGVEALVDAQVNLEVAIRSGIRKQFIKNSQSLMRQGYDYAEIDKLLQSSGEIFLQVVYLNLDIQFYHDLSAIILTNQEYNESPESDLEDFLTHMRFQLHHFINLKASRAISKIELLCFHGIAMQSLKHQQILQRFIDQKIDNLTSFEYLSLPKFSVEVDSNAIIRSMITRPESGELNQREILQNISSNLRQTLENREGTEFPNLSEHSEFFHYAYQIDNPNYLNINFMCLNYKSVYSWEMSGGTQYNFVNTGQTEKLIVHLLSAISTNTSIMLRGPSESGKSSTIEMFSNILAKPFFTWVFSNSSDTQSINQVLIGTAQGGFATLIKNCEELSMSMLSTLASIVFAIRNQCINNSDDIRYCNNSIKVSDYWGIYASFSYKENSKAVSFNQIPSILESFRTVAIVTPQMQVILTSKFTFLNFVNPPETAQRFLLFMQTLSSSLSNSHFLITNQQEPDFSMTLRKQQELLQHYLNPCMSTIMGIISTAESFLFEKKVENSCLQDNYSLLYSSLLCYYQSCLSPTYQKLIFQLFQSSKLSSFGLSLTFFIQGFPEYQMTECYSYKKLSSLNQPKEDSQEKSPSQNYSSAQGGFGSVVMKYIDPNQDFINEHINEFFQKNSRIKVSERFVNIIEHMTYCLAENKSLIIVGYHSQIKNLAIDAAAYSLSVEQKSPFQKHYITMDANDIQYLMGCFDENGWKKGIVQQLLDVINNLSEMQQYSECQKEYLLSQVSSFISSPANPSHEADQKNADASQGQKKSQASQTPSPQFSLDDWLIFETNSSNFKGDSLIEPMVSSINTGTFYFDNGQLISINNKTKRIITVESLENITPGIMSGFQLFNLIDFSPEMNEDGCFSLQSEFQGWMESISKKNKFFCFCEKTLRSCYIYLLLPAMNFLISILNRYQLNSTAKNNIPLNNPGIVKNIVSQAHKNFLGILEIFLNEFRKTMISTGVYAITSSSSTMKDVKSKAFYTFITLQKRNEKLAGSSTEQIQQSQVNTDGKYLEKQFRDPLESVFLFSVIQGIVVNYLDSTKDIKIFTQEIFQNVKKLQKSHKTIYAEKFKACQNFQDIFQDNSNLTLVDVVYDLHDQKWVKLAQFEITNDTAFLDNSLTNDHLDGFEIIRLNREALQIKEMKTFAENENQMVYQLPDISKHTLYLSSPFKLTKFMINYLMGYRKSIFLFSPPQSGKTRLTNHLEKVHLGRNEIRIMRLSLGKFTGISKFQSQFENFLSFKNLNVKTSEIGKCSYAFIDDLNLVPSEGPCILGCLRSLLSHQGWFSQNKNRVLKFENCHLLCNYSSHTTFSKDFKQFLRISGCIQESFLLKLQQLDSQDLSGIFLTLMKSSECFDSQQKISQNLQQASILQKLFIKFALFFSKSQSKLMHITQIYKTPLTVDNAITVVSNLLQQNQYVSQITSKSHFLQLWKYLVDEQFLKCLPWNNKESMLLQFQASKQTNHNFVFNLMSEKLEEEFIGLEHVPKSYANRVSHQDSIKIILNTEEDEENKNNGQVLKFSKSKSSCDKESQVDQKYEELEDENQFEERTKYLSEQMHETVEENEYELLEQVNEKEFDNLPSELSDIFCSILEATKQTDQDMIFITRLTSLIQEQQEQLQASTLLSQKEIVSSTLISNLSTVTNTTEQQLVNSQIIRFINQLEKNQYQLIRINKNEYIQELKDKFQEFLTTADQPLKLQAYWDIEVLRGGVSQIYNDIQSVTNNVYSLKRNISLFSSVNQSQLIQFSAYLMKSEYIHVSISSPRFKITFLNHISDLLKQIVEGKAKHTLFHIQISELKGEEFKRVLEIFYVLKSITEEGGIENIMPSKQIKKILEPWKASQNKRLTQMSGADDHHISNSTNSRINCLEGNLIDNHLVNVLGRMLKGLSNFIIEVHLDNYAEFQLFKEQMPKSLAHFSDHFSVDDPLFNSSNFDNSQIDLLKLNKNPVHEQFWKVEREVSSLFELNYFSTGRRGELETAFYSPFLAQLIEQQLQSTMNIIKSKQASVAEQLINPDMVREPINQKLKELLEQLLNSKIDYTNAKSQYDMMCEIYLELEALHKNQKKDFSSIVIAALFQKNMPENTPNHSLNVTTEKDGRRRTIMEKDGAVRNDTKSVGGFQKLEDCLEERNRLKIAMVELKAKYDKAFYNFRQINLLLCQLLKAIQYYRLNVILRHECHPLLTFNDSDLKQYSQDLALYSLASLRYPAIYRERLFHLLLENNKKLALPFYKVLLDNPTSFLEVLVSGQSLGLHIINEFSLILMLLNLDLLPLSIVDETGLFLEYLKKYQKKRIVVIEHNTVDNNTLEKIENAILSGQTLVLFDPDVSLIEMVSPLIRFKYSSLIRQLTSPPSKEKKQNPKGEDFFIFNNKKTKFHPQFRLIFYTNEHSNYLPKILQDAALFVHLSLQDKSSFGSIAYDIILNSFRLLEKNKIIRSQIQKIDTISKEDYSILNLLPFISQIDLFDDSTWISLERILPSSILHSASQNGDIEDMIYEEGEDQQKNIQAQILKKKIEDLEKDQLLLKDQNQGTIKNTPSGSSSIKQSFSELQGSKDPQETYGDVQLHQNIGKQLSQIKQEDVDTDRDDKKFLLNKRINMLKNIALLKSPNNTPSNQNQKEMSSQRSVNIKKDDMNVSFQDLGSQREIRGDISMTENEDKSFRQEEDDDNDWILQQTRLEQFFIFDFEIVDYQHNSRLAPHYPTSHLLALSREFKLLVEILYGIKLSYKEMLTQIEREDQNIRYSDENYILILRQVSDTLRANIDTKKPLVVTSSFIKQFASAFFHHLLCTLKEDHQAVWLLVLQFYFQMTSSGNKIPASFVHQQILLNQKITPLQTNLFSMLTTEKFYQDFAQSLSQLYGSYDDLVAPLINFHGFGEKDLSGEQKQKRLSLLKSQVNLFKSKKTIPLLRLNGSNLNSPHTQNTNSHQADQQSSFRIEIQGQEDKLGSDAEKSSVKEESNKTSNINSGSIEERKEKRRDKSIHFNEKDLKEMERTNQNVIHSPNGISMINQDQKGEEMSPIISLNNAQFTRNSSINTKQKSSSVHSDTNKLSPIKFQGSNINLNSLAEQLSQLQLENENIDILVKEEDFKSPLSSAHILNMQQINLDQSPATFSLAVNRLNQRIIDLPMIRNHESQDKNYIKNLENEMLSGARTGIHKEKISELNPKGLTEAQQQYVVQAKMDFPGKQLNENSTWNQEERLEIEKIKEKLYEESSVPHLSIFHKEGTPETVSRRMSLCKRQGILAPSLASEMTSFDSDMWFGASAYNALQQASKILMSEELEQELISFNVDKDNWKKMFLKSHSEMTRDSDGFLAALTKRLSPNNLMLLFKYLRPDLLETIFITSSVQTLSRFFVSNSRTNLNTHTRANWYSKPTIILHGKLNKSICELLELKACKANANIKVRRIPLKPNNNNIHDLHHVIKVAQQKGEWLLFENIEFVESGGRNQLLKILNDCLEKQSHDNFRLWFTCQNSNETYQLNNSYKIIRNNQTFNENNSQPLKNFLSKCFKICLNKPENIKSHLSVLYTLEIHEYLACVEKKVTKKLQNNYNFSTIGKQLQTPFHDLMKFRFKKQKRQVMIANSFNLHSLFIDKEKLKERNKQVVALLEKASNKIKFSIMFVFAVLRQKETQLQLQSRYYSNNTNQLYFSDLDLLFIVDDAFYFLQFYPTNISAFLRNYLNLIFSESTHYNSSNIWSITSMRDLLEELALKAFDKQTIYEIQDQKYSLFYEQSDSTTEQSIFTTINELPNIDPPQMLELSQNNEIQKGYERSLKMIARLHKRVNMRNQDSTEAEIVNKLQIFLNKNLSQKQNTEEEEENKKKEEGKLKDKSSTIFQEKEEQESNDKESRVVSIKDQKELKEEETQQLLDNQEKKENNYVFMEQLNKEKSPDNKEQQESKDQEPIVSLQDISDKQQKESQKSQDQEIAVSQKKISAQKSQEQKEPSESQEIQEQKKPQEQKKSQELKESQEQQDQQNKEQREQQNNISIQYDKNEQGTSDKEKDEQANKESTDSKNNQSRDEEKNQDSLKSLVLININEEIQAQKLKIEEEQEEIEDKNKGKEQDKIVKGMMEVQLYWMNKVSLIDKSECIVNQILKLQDQFSILFTNFVEQIDIFKVPLNKISEDPKENQEIQEEDDKDSGSEYQKQLSLLSSLSSHQSSEEEEEEEEAKGSKIISIQSSHNDVNKYLNKISPRDQNNAVNSHTSRQRDSESSKKIISSPRQSRPGSKQSHLMKWFTEKPLNLQLSNSRKSQLILNFSDFQKDRSTSLQQFQQQNNLGSASPNIRVQHHSHERKSIPFSESVNASQINSPLLDSNNGNFLSVRPLDDLNIKLTSPRKNAPTGAKSNYFGRLFAGDQQTIMNSPLNRSINSQGSKKDVKPAPKMSVFNPFQRNSILLLSADRKSLLGTSPSAKNLTKVKSNFEQRLSQGQDDNQANDTDSQLNSSRNMNNNGTSPMNQNKTLNNNVGSANLIESTKHLFKSLILNEYLLGRNILKLVINDLLDLKDSQLLYQVFNVNQNKRSKSNEEILRNQYLQQVLVDIITNNIPERWKQQSFLQNNQQLTSFIRILVTKLEFIKILIEDRKCVMYPIIQLNQLFDPFHLLSNFIRKTAQQLQLSIVDVSIEAEILSKPVISQPNDSSIYISGLFLKRGKLSLSNYMLETEDTRELEYKLPNLKITVKKKVFNNNLYTQHQPSLTIHLKDDIIYDFEGTFYQQNQFINGIKKPYKIEGANKKAGGEKAFLVRLPIVNSLTNHVFNQFPLRIFFYLKSSQPQEFWVKRGAEIYLQQDFF